MKTKLIALFAALILALTLGVSPAAADQYNSVACYGYTYNSNVNFTRNGNVTFAHWAISGPLAMEYRVRWYSPDGTLIYDTGYVGWQPTNPYAYPNVGRYFTSNSSVLINAGKWGDNQPTCPMSFTIPPA